MLTDLPFYISLFFVVVTLVTYWFFIAAVRKNNFKTVLLVSVIMMGWLGLQAFLSLQLFYTATGGMPPRLMWAVIPVWMLIIFLFLTRGGKKFIDSLSPAILTLLHVVRVFVEIILFLLCTHKYIPVEMTFEGRNFDIAAGLTAPLIYYYGFVKNKLSKIFLLTWNVICLILLLNIVGNAVLAAPFPFQQFAFDQPNIAVLYFPFVWLPAFIVPVVLFSHLVLIRRLLKNENI